MLLLVEVRDPLHFDLCVILIETSKEILQRIARAPNSPLDFVPRPSPYRHEETLGVHKRQADRLSSDLGGAVDSAVTRPDELGLPNMTVPSDLLHHRIRKVRSHIDLKQLLHAFPVRRLEIQNADGGRIFPRQIPDPAAR